MDTNERRYHVLVDALSEFVLLTDHEGQVVGAQPSWAEFTGQRESETDGAGWRAMVHVHDRDALDETWTEGIASAAVFTIRARILHGSSGEYRHCEGRAAPVRDHDGNVAEWIAAIADVHDRVQAAARERTAAERFRRVFGANVFALGYGEHDRVLDGNNAFLDMVRARRRDLQAGVPITDLITANGAGGLEGLVDGDGTECEIHRRDGTIGYAIATAVSLAPERGWLLVAVDVSARKEAEAAVLHLSLHDPLTGLPNRRLLIDRLSHALARAARRRSLVGVLFCDLDRFKSVNDQFGHEAGDQVLLEVSDRLGSMMRECDTVGRFGGDEFVVVLEDITAPDDAALIADRIRVRLEEPITIGSGRHVTVGCSVGAALSKPDSEAETMLAEADEAMYADKTRERTTHVDFQAVIDLRDGKAVAASIAANGTGTLPVERAIQLAGPEFARWRRDNPESQDCPLHVTVSAPDFADAGFVDRVLAAVSAIGCAPGDVCVEVAADAAEVSEIIGALRDHGIGVVVKIDRPSVAKLPSCDQTRQAVEHTIDLAHQRALVVVGDGVETLAQMAILDELGCDRAQGRLMGGPGPVDQISGL